MSVFIQIKITSKPKCIIIPSSIGIDDNDIEEYLTNKYGVIFMWWID